jgi:hypothetical protein
MVAPDVETYMQVFPTNALVLLGQALLADDVAVMTQGSLSVRRS